MCFFFLPAFLPSPGGKGHLLSELPNWVYTHSPQQHCSCCACAPCLCVCTCQRLPHPHFMRASFENDASHHRGVPSTSPSSEDTLAWLSASPMSVVACVSSVLSSHPSPHPPSSSLPACPVNQTLTLCPPQAWARRMTPSWCRSGSSWFRRKTPWSAMSRNSWFCKYDANNTSEWEEMWKKGQSIIHLCSKCLILESESMWHMSRCNIVTKANLIHIYLACQPGHARMRIFAWSEFWELKLIVSLSNAACRYWKHKLDALSRKHALSKWKHAFSKWKCVSVFSCVNLLYYVP